MMDGNPYVGPRAFEEADRAFYFGREREARQLLSLAVARPVVLLYAPSGAGKTSLLKASLLPSLREMRDVTVLPLARVGGAALCPGTANVYTASLLSYLLGEEGGCGLTLTRGLESRIGRAPEGERSRPHFLVLDQFEELFTAWPDRWRDRGAFMHELGDALAACPQITLILSMREDYIAQLDPWRGLLPDHLRTRFRLDLLEADAARRAAVEPARAAGVTFQDAAAGQLIDELRLVTVQDPDGTARKSPGQFVDPVHLQVVCRRLWERLPAGAREIGVDDVAAEGGVDQALARYYAERVAAASQETGVAERAVRDWVERHLITAHGLRGQTLREPERTQGLDNRAVESLTASHLVRAEERRGAVWFELAHDRLVEPVRKDNAAWRDAHLSTLERQAAHWDRERRPAGLLLSGAALRSAEAWAARQGNGLPAVERDFLAACRRERWRTRRLRLYAVAATLCLIVAVTAFLQARQDRQRALLSGLAAQAMAEAPERLDRALLLALEADRWELPATLPLLARTLESSPHLETVLHGHQSEVLDLAWNPDGHRLASVDDDGVVRLWDAHLRKPRQTLTRMDGRAWSVDWSADGRWLAAGGDQGVLVWDPRSPARRPRALTAPDESAVYVLRFSPDGRTLAAATADNTVLRWDSVTGRLLGPPWTGPTDWITSLAWSPDGEILAAAGMERRVWRWRAATGELLGTAPPPRAHAEGITGLAFSPDGGTLASSSLDGTLAFWDPVTGERRGEPLSASLPGDLWGVAFSPDGQRLAAGSEEGTLLWDAHTLRLVDPLFGGHEGKLRRLAFRPDGRLLASGNGGDVVLWSVDPGPRLGRFVTLPPEQAAAAVPRASRETRRAIETRLGMRENFLSAIATSPDGRFLATAGRDRRISLWDARSGTLIAGPLAGHRYEIASLAFEDGGKTLLSADNKGTLIRWDVDPASWRRLARRVANRELTAEERRRFLK
ncbi:MAG TPA: WD40 repeat domain-containing protein [Thermoanaerobaculia bacterium]